MSIMVLGLTTLRLTLVQLVSVISLLSADVPDLNSPANVDAAKEVREDFPCQSDEHSMGGPWLTRSAYKKKVKRLARKSAEEAYE
jgi:ubiquitin-conjugating enzyme E2 G1